MLRLSTCGVIFTLTLVIVLIRAQFPSQKPCFCKLAVGTIDECGCSVDSVDIFNNEKFYPLLQSLLQRNFFRYYKVNMDRPCPFWQEEHECSAEGLCGIKDCDEEVPEGLKSPPGSADRDQCDENALDPLDDHISDVAKAAFQRWYDFDVQEDKYCDVEEENSTDLHYVDLVRNPERYTGYKGPSAARVWKSIYLENCFKPDPKFDKNFLLNPRVSGLCLEKRVYYRIISAFHTSITVQVCANHYQPPVGAFGSGKWVPNIEMFKQRFSEEATGGEGPSRLKNLYFLYMLELRALQKAAPYFRKEFFYTGNTKEDEETRRSVAELVTLIDNNLPEPFDESQMFKCGGNRAQAMQLKEEFRLHFWNVSRIMDCVGCDKCRLWGKLNVHGMGTALRILFADLPHEKIQNGSWRRFELSRNDVVALFNSIGRFASSIKEVGMFRKLINEMK